MILYVHQRLCDLNEKDICSLHTFRRRKSSTHLIKKGSWLLTLLGAFLRVLKWHKIPNHVSHIGYRCPIHVYEFYTFCRFFHSFLFTAGKPNVISMYFLENVYKSGRLRLTTGAHAWAHKFQSELKRPPIQPQNYLQLRQYPAIKRISCCVVRFMNPFVTLVVQFKCDMKGTKSNLRIKKQMLHIFPAHIDKRDADLCLLKDQQHSCDNFLHKYIEMCFDIYIYI